MEGGRLAVELLLARAMGCKKIELYTRFEQEPSEAQRSAFRELVRQAGGHAPIAYLLGFREFFSLEFKVSPAVLIPRPETEALEDREESVQALLERAGHPGRPAHEHVNHRRAPECEMHGIVPPTNQPG